MKNSRGGWVVAAILGIGLILLSFYTYNTRGGKGPGSINWNDSGKSVVIGSPPPAIPRSSIRCDANGCYLVVEPDSATVPPGTQPISLVFTTKGDIPANTRIELKIQARTLATKQ